MTAIKVTNGKSEDGLQCFDQQGKPVSEYQGEAERWIGKNDFPSQDCYVITSPQAEKNWEDKADGNEVAKLLNEREPVGVEETKPYFAQINGEAQIEVDAVDIFDACNKTLEIYKRDWWKDTIEISGTSISFRIWSQYGDAAM